MAEARRPAFLQPRRKGGDEEEWISVSDLMSSLMVIFLFIAISYLRPAVDERTKAEAAQAEAQRATERVRDIVVAFQETENQLASRLEETFRDDLPRWGAEFDRPALAIRFRSPDVLFEQGRAQLRPAFREVLVNFLPRYAAVLAEFPDSIEEIKIEGHTSSEWSGSANAAEAYANNMALSQERTRAVLQFWLVQTTSAERVDWLRRTATANGLASSRPIRRPDGSEDRERSRRVEFRVTTKARERVLRVLEAVQ